jgi:putative sigma-54 modulation protein
MKANIRGEKVEVTKSIKEYINDRLKRLDKYFENPNEEKCNVKVRVKNFEQTIEVTIPTKKFTIRAEESNKDLYAAIDLVVDKLESQISKNKAKIKDKYKNVPDFELNLDFETEEPEQVLKIVKRKDIDTKPMNEDEAIIQMQLLNHDFFVFKNIDEECVSVIYLRKDGKFGIINVK